MTTGSEEEEVQNYNEMLVPINKMIGHTVVQEVTKALNSSQDGPWGHLAIVDGSRGVDECCDQLLANSLESEEVPRVFFLFSINTRADEFSRNIEHCLKSKDKSGLFGKYLAKCKPLE